MLCNALQKINAMHCNMHCNVLLRTNSIHLAFQSTQLHCSTEECTAMAAMYFKLCKVSTALCKNAVILQHTATYSCNNSCDIYSNILHTAA